MLRSRVLHHRLCCYIAPSPIPLQAYNVLKNPDHKRMYDSGDLIEELVG
jgi:hypothetical protein